MSTSLPLMQDEVFLEEHRRIHMRLWRLKKFSAPDSGFSTTRSALTACMDEIELLLPDLMDHFAKEERAVLRTGSESGNGEEQQKMEQLIAEHQPFLREVRVLLESGWKVVHELGEDSDSESLAEALKVYLAACVEDLLEHERKEHLLLN